MLVAIIKIWFLFDTRSVIGLSYKCNSSLLNLFMRKYLLKGFKLLGMYSSLTKKIKMEVDSTSLNYNIMQSKVSLIITTVIQLFKVDPELFLLLQL